MWPTGHAAVHPGPPIHNQDGLRNLSLLQHDQTNIHPAREGHQPNTEHVHAVCH